ncbi:MAG: succinylglutamate desuccinylase/aspartoacylase family protein [Alphaproteobacteria bacterium]|nr:succinylglutamate desuccinylase/aspartoacylase family protein [Alphaproteobacteria bacterium]
MVDRFPMELVAPDIAPHVGNTGIPYVTTLRAAVSGPHIVLAALIHGNEICGAIALDHLLRHGIAPARGALTFAFCNVEAYRRFDPERPNASRYLDEDMNRLWDRATLDGPRRSTELRRARALRPVFDNADYLLDLHSMQYGGAPLILAGIVDKSVELARRIRAPGVIVRDHGHAAGPRLRDYDAFADPASPRAALLVECGQHWEESAADVATVTAYRFLAACGALTPEASRKALEITAPPQRVIEVTEAITVASDDFRFAAPYRGLEVIPRAGTEIARDGGRAVVTPYDDCVLVMPSQQLARGHTAVRLGRYAP